MSDWLRADMNPSDPGSQGYASRFDRDAARMVLIEYRRSLQRGGEDLILDALEKCIKPCNEHGGEA